MERASHVSVVNSMNLESGWLLTGQNGLFIPVRNVIDIIRSAEAM